MRLGGFQFTTRGLHFEKIITVHYCNSVYVLHTKLRIRCKHNQSDNCKTFN